MFSYIIGNCCLHDSCTSCIHALYTFLALVGFMLNVVLGICLASSDPGPLSVLVDSWYIRIFVSTPEFFQCGVNVVSTYTE